jgi:hypothetical protein
MFASFTESFKTSTKRAVQYSNTMYSVHCSCPFIAPFSLVCGPVDNDTDCDARILVYAHNQHLLNFLNFKTNHIRFEACG